jgi:selenide,water dikinase
MLSSSPPFVAKDLVLIGGGHSHAIALRALGMNPLPNVRLTLITDVLHTPYSGMLPGYLAGLYTFDACHIDLQPLAKFTGARLIHDQAIALDLATNQVQCAHHPPISFDVLSVDIGSTPLLATVPGAKDYAIPVKPISKFLRVWDAIVENMRQEPRPMKLGVVGGGAGGVELSLSVRANLRRILHQAGRSPDDLEMHVFQRGSELLPERSPWVRHKMQQLMTQRGIRLHLRETVVEVQADRVRCESGLEVACDRLFWVTQASAAPWIRESGLATDERGFMRVNDCLQSVSHPQVFAAGDIATMVNHPRPKAGVFAVRQGKPLTENLRRAVQGQPLQPFSPQKQFLILIGLGDKTAVASRDPFGFGPTSWLWRWKDNIDRKFMDQFSYLPAMGTDSASTAIAPEIPTMHCAGCGAKVGSNVLEQVLTRIQAEQEPTADVQMGLDAPDDAAVIQVPANRLLVQTVDYFRALVDDPFLFGQIAANHALSDLFAMGAQPQSALAIATLPYATPKKLQEQLYHLLSGATKVLQATGASLIGGHTTEGSDLAFGLTCNGVVEETHLLRKNGLQADQALILTKPLGTGTLFAADMQFKAKGRWIEGAIASMLVSNAAAAQCFLQHGATACTDITGFGLLGHLVEMMRASNRAVSLNLNAIPVLDGATETLRHGYLSSIHPQNQQAARWLDQPQAAQRDALYPLLFDPQTSGGLLASIPNAQVDACLAALRTSGYPHSVIVGHTLEAGDPLKVQLQE